MIFNNSYYLVYLNLIYKGTDGGPDENPRYEKNIMMGCKTFQQYALDLFVETTNAPGLSAYNKV